MWKSEQIRLVFQQRTTPNSCLSVCAYDETRNGRGSTLSDSVARGGGDRAGSGGDAVMMYATVAQVDCPSALRMARIKLLGVRPIPNCVTLRRLASRTQCDTDTACRRHAQMRTFIHQTGKTTDRRLYTMTNTYNLEAACNTESTEPVKSNPAFVAS